MSRCFRYSGFESKTQQNENDLSKKDKNKKHKKTENENGKKRNKGKEKEGKKKKGRKDRDGKKERDAYTKGVYREKNGFLEGEHREEVYSDNHNRGDRFPAEVCRNTSDSDIVPAGVSRSGHSFNSGGKAGLNDTRFVKESTNDSLRGVYRSGGQNPTAINGYCNGGPNHLHLSMKSGRGRLREPEWNDRYSNSSGGESSRSQGYHYCNGNGRSENRRHLQGLHPPTKPLTVIMDHKSTPAMAEVDPHSLVGRSGRQPVEETRTGQKDNLLKPNPVNLSRHEPSDRRRIHGGDDGMKQTIHGSAVGEGGKRKREDEKHVGKEERARIKKERKALEKEMRRAAKREEKAKRREQKSRKKAEANEIRKRLSISDHGAGNDRGPDCTTQPSLPPFPTDVDPFRVVQSPRRGEDLRPAGILKVAVANPNPTKRRNAEDWPPDPRSGETKEGDRDVASSSKTSQADWFPYDMPPLPEAEPELPQTDDMDWLFNDSGGFRLRGRNQSPPGAEVWADPLRIESADVIALPYVIPY